MQDFHLKIGSLKIVLFSDSQNRLGLTNGNWVEVSPDTVEILDLTKDICEITDGALDPTVGTLVKLWSVDHPNHRVPSPQEIEEALKKSRL